MFVRQLIGRNAGQIQDQPYHAATSNISMGTAATVTDEELRAAGLTPPPRPEPAPLERFPDGYVCKPDEVTGYNVFDPDGKAINQQPFQNLVAARAAAAAHSEKAGNDAPKLDKMTRAELEAFAASKSIDVSAAKNKGEIIALIEAAAAPVGGNQPPVAA